MDLKLKKLKNFTPRKGPLLLIIMDGVGLGKQDESNALYVANTPCLDKLFKSELFASLQAHGTAVGLPSDEDMGNSEVGHNAIGAGRVFDQGAKLVAVASGTNLETTHPDSPRCPALDLVLVQLWISSAAGVRTARRADSGGGRWAAAAHGSPVLAVAALDPGGRTAVGRLDGAIGVHGGLGGEQRLAGRAAAPHRTPHHPISSG